jgi:hypothetical protein
MSLASSGVVVNLGAAVGERCRHVDLLAGGAPANPRCDQARWVELLPLLSPSSTSSSRTVGLLSHAVWRLGPAVGVGRTVGELGQKQHTEAVVCWQRHPGGRLVAPCFTFGGAVPSSPPAPSSPPRFGGTGEASALLVGSTPRWRSSSALPLLLRQPGDPGLLDPGRRFVLSPLKMGGPVGLHDVAPSPLSRRSYSLPSFTTDA